MFAEKKDFSRSKVSSWTNQSALLNSSFPRIANLNKGSWSLPESKLHINYLELKAVLLALKEFQALCTNNTVLIATDNTTVVAYINKEGGNEVGPSMCPTMENSDLVYQKTGYSQSSTHPRPSERDSRQAIQTGLDYSNRMVPQSRRLPSNMPPVAPAHCGPVCHQVQQAPTVCLTGPRPPGMGSGCSQPVMGRTGPVHLSTNSHLGQSGGEVAGLPVQQNHTDCTGMAQLMPWFWNLVEMSSQIPLYVPSIPNLVSQPFNQVLHRNLSNLNLHAWLLEPQQSRSRVSLRQWQHELRLLKEDQPDLSMKQSGPFLQSGASIIRWISGYHL